MKCRTKRSLGSKSMLIAGLCVLSACQGTSSSSGAKRISAATPQNKDTSAPQTNLQASAPVASTAETSSIRELPKGPTQVSEIASFYAGRCPVAPFTLPQPETRTVAGHSFAVHGSRWERLGGAWSEELRIGVLGALKDASPATRANVQRAAKRFQAEKVNFVVANGDLGEDRELDDVFFLLGESFSVPVLVFAGNMEWTAAFSEAFAKAGAKHPQLINGNWARHIDLGGVHLLTLPGWSNRSFMQSGACRYGDADLEDLRRLAKPLVEAGEPIVLLTHGPPRGDGPEALDMTYDSGNVGNEQLRHLIDELPISFGIFSHILESGGRIRSGFADGALLKSPVRKPQTRLYLNAGSASAFAWEMLDKSRSEGMAAVFRLRDGKATARTFPLNAKR